MKTLLKLSLVGLMFFFATSCEESLTELNIDPDASPTADVAQVLTSAQGVASFVVEGQVNENSYLWAQYWTWGPGVSLGSRERFVVTPAASNGLWGTSYATVLADLKFVEENGSPAYQGIAKVMKSYMYQILVDFFGDIPYTEALNGEIKDGGVLTPTYDDAKAVYTDLAVQLDEAIALLSSPAAGSVGAEDLIYGGNLSKWVKLANSLKLKVLMRQSVADPSVGAAVSALVASGDFITSASDIASIGFSGETGGQNPMFAIRESGVGFFYVASNASLNALDALGDPRKETLYVPATTGPNAGQIVGIDQSAVTEEPFTNPVSHYGQGSAVTYGATNEVIFMSPWEVYFLRAEAAARFGTADNETATFESGVNSHFAYIGTAGAAGYIASLGYSSGASLDARIGQIAVQKWISMNGLQEGEGWIESRRLDTPSNPIFTGTAGVFQRPMNSALSPGVFPASWLIPESERSFNPNAPAQRVITDKIFWDN